MRGRHAFVLAASVTLFAVMVACGAFEATSTAQDGGASPLIDGGAPATSDGTATPSDDGGLSPEWSIVTAKLAVDGGASCVGGTRRLFGPQNDQATCSVCQCGGTTCSANVGCGKSTSCDNPELTKPVAPGDCAVFNAAQVTSPLYCNATVRIGGCSPPNGGARVTGGEPWRGSLDLCGLTETGGQRCVVRHGDALCPRALPHRTLVFDPVSFVDNRQCSPCLCRAVCNTQVVVQAFDDLTCGSGPFTSVTGQCTSAASYVDAGFSVRIAPGTTGAVPCGLTGQAAISGQIERGTPDTLCCTTSPF